MRGLPASIGLCAWLVAGTGCGSSSSIPTSQLVNGPTLPVVSGNNVLPLTVNGAQCSAGSYRNKPCVTVTVCEPGTSTCQTVSDILLDTGSFGLRIFKAALADVTLPAVTANGTFPLAECGQFGIGNDWGPIAQADVVLGGEPAVTASIQIIDSTFATVPASCDSPDTSAAQAGFNGILGVGLFPRDCGGDCATDPNNGIYFACSDSDCVGATVAPARQLQNPVALLPTDNNGLIIELPSVQAGGQSEADGYLVLGIGTESNNSPNGVIAYTANPGTADYTTSFDGETSSSFVDTGSNGYFFPAGSSSDLTDCGEFNTSLKGWYCPSSTLGLSAVSQANSGSPSSNVPFYVGNFVDLASSPNSVFAELAGSISVSQNSTFDWGLPFFLGRNVYVGFEGSSSSLGSGPLWAY